MKWILILGLVTLLSVETNRSYTGEWNWQNDRSSLTLTLSQKDSIVTGFHNSIMLGGNRIDVAFPGDTTIHGVVKKDGSLVIKIKSGYDVSAIGTAKINFVGQDSIFFEFITPPKGMYWIPNKVTLVKQTTSN